MDISLLPYISFALSLGGLVVRVFLRSDSRKLTVLGIVITCLVVLTGVGIYQSLSHKRRVEAAAKEIVGALGNSTRTFDELQEILYKPDFPLTTEALDALVSTNKVGQKILDVRDELGRHFRVRGYYVTATSK